MLTRFLFTANVLSTLAMFGIIWFVQLVHYPLFLRADPDTFAALETDHARRTCWIAFPLMFAELLTSTLLLWSRLRPAFISQAQMIVGLVLVLLCWCSTVFLQIPLHNRLQHGFNRSTIQRLIGTNWLRTFTWTARTALVTSWLLHLAAHTVC